MLSFFLAFLVSSASYAGSICNDGTYSYSEGRGTCSWHGGVAVSGVYQDQSLTYKKSISAQSKRDFSQWDVEYNTTSDGTPYHSAIHTDKSTLTLFSYVCYVVENNKPLESIVIGVARLNIEDQLVEVLAPKDHVKVFTHTTSGVRRISGSWSWQSEEGNLLLTKTGPGLSNPANYLSKKDMVYLLLADYLIVSIKGRKDVVVPVPDIASKVSSTWNKCYASR